MLARRQQFGQTGGKHDFVTESLFAVNQQTQHTGVAAQPDRMIVDALATVLRLQAHIVVQPASREIMLEQAAQASMPSCQLKSGFSRYCRVITIHGHGLL